MPTEVDPITLSVVQGALQATQRAMTTTMEKTGRSSVYAIARDYSNALFDWDARMIIQGEDIPTHLGSMVLATKAVARFFEGDINPGDIYLHNDPTYDGSHLPDMCMYKPLFFEDELVFWVVSKGHMVDVGGPVPGSYNPDAKEIYAEGLRVPPIRLVDRGEMRHDVLNMILTNFRSRKFQSGDMNAQLGAITLGEQRLTALLERYGKAVIKNCVERLLDAAEAHMRDRIRTLPDGVYESSVLAEDTGHGRGHQTLEAEITVAGDELKIALASPPQLEFFTNSYRSNTLSGVYAGLLMWAQVQPPFNEGLYRAVKVDFGPVPDDAVAAALVSEGLAEADRAPLVAAAAAGNLHRARVLAADKRVAARREAWWGAPDRLDGAGATVALLVAELREMIDEAGAALTERHRAEMAALDEREARFGTRGSGRRDIEAQHKREHRQFRTDEIRFGLATLGARYREQIALQPGDPASDRRAMRAIDRLRATAESLIRSPNEALALQALLLDLPPVAEAVHRQ